MDIFAEKFNRNINDTTTEAMKVPRELFDKGPNWDFDEWREKMLTKVECEDIPTL